MIIYNGNANEASDVIECAETILTTPYGSMPYMRDMGITSDVLGMSSPNSMESYFNQAVDQIDMWEERASVSEVYADKESKNLKPKVVLEKGE